MGKEFERKRSQDFNDVFTASLLSDRKVPILDVRLIEVCFKTELTVLYITLNKIKINYILEQNLVKF